MRGRAWTIGAAFREQRSGWWRSCRRKRTDRSGRQVWSWVAIDDVIAAIRFSLASAQLQGPVNVVAPYPVTNAAFTRALGRALRRPTIFSVPELALRTFVGDMAEELLLFGVRVAPRKLQDAGYEFRYPELETALKHVLKA